MHAPVKRPVRAQQSALHVGLFRRILNEAWSLLELLPVLQDILLVWSSELSCCAASGTVYASRWRAAHREAEPQPSESQLRAPAPMSSLAALSPPQHARRKHQTYHELACTPPCRLGHLLGCALVRAPAPRCPAPASLLELPPTEALSDTWSLEEQARQHGCTPGLCRGSRQCPPVSGWRK